MPPVRVSRRALLSSAALAMCHPVIAGAAQTPGVALYTVRELLPKQPVETLRALAAIGYREAEVLRSQVAPLTRALRDAGIEPVSVHFETPLITGNWQAWKDAEMPPLDEGITFESALAEAARQGLQYMVFNYLPPKERLDVDYYGALADKLNAAAEKTRAAGLRFAYHNHNFEFQRKPGGRPIDTLLERLDPQLVRLEVDLFWVSMAGEDPAAFLRRVAGRVEMVHLKDRGPGIAPRFDIASVPHSTFREVGNGDLDFPAMLRAASEARVKHYFVEQDHTPDPLGSLRISYASLRKLGLWK